LHLSVLAKESGYLGLIGQSAQTVTMDGKKLAIQSRVYYMLTRDRPINYLHWLAPDDTHILIEGGPVDYFIFHPDGHAEMVTLGRDVAAGQRPLVAIPAGCWKALRLHKGANYEIPRTHWSKLVGYRRKLLRSYTERRAGNAYRGYRLPLRIEQWHGNAAQAFLQLFVVYRIAAPAGFLDLDAQRFGSGDGAMSESLERVRRIMSAARSSGRKARIALPTEVQ
jgi:hypothetical protein